MSDTFILCPKCGEEIYLVGLLSDYYCKNCDEYYTQYEVRIVATEYLKGEEDEGKNNL